MAKVPAEKLLTVAEVCDILTCKQSFLYDAVQHGRIEHVRIGTQALRFTRRNVDDFIASRTVAVRDRPEPIGRSQRARRAS